MDKLKRLIEIAGDMDIALLLELAISLREPIITRKPGVLHEAGLTRTVCFGLTTSRDLTEEGELLAQQIHDIFDGVSEEDWRQSFEEWYNLFPMKVGERRIRTGKTKAAKLFKEATTKVPGKELVDILAKDINSRSHKETMWMPGPVKWLEDEHYMNISPIQNISLHGKEIA